MSDSDDLPPKASPRAVDAAVAYAVETDDDASVVEQIEAADVAAAVEAGRFRDHRIVKLLGFLSEISDQPPAFTLATAASVGGVLTQRPRLAEAGLRALAVLTVATAAKSAVKAVVVRTRPFMLLERGEYETGLMGPNDGPWNSFPSGHTANAVGVARAVSRVLPEAAAPLGLAAAGIAAVQVPRATHHPLDVIAGAALGWASEAAVNCLWEVARRAQAKAKAHHAEG